MVKTVYEKSLEYNKLLSQDSRGKAATEYLMTFPVVERAEILRTFNRFIREI